jgi:hypothetical protein
VLQKWNLGAIIKMIDMGSLKSNDRKLCIDEENMVFEDNYSKRALYQISGSKNGIWVPNTEFWLEIQNLGSKIRKQIYITYILNNENIYYRRSIKHK